MSPFHGAVLRARAGRPCTQPLLTTASLGAYPPTCLAVGFGAARTIVAYRCPAILGTELKRVAATGEPPRLLEEARGGAPMACVSTTTVTS